MRLSLNLSFRTCLAVGILTLVAACFAAAFQLARHRSPNAGTLSFEIAAAQPAHSQLFFDTGNGFNEPQSAWQVLPPSAEFQQGRFELPIGTYHKFRIDPFTTPGSLRIRNLRLLDSDGRTLHEFPLKEISPNEDVALYQVESTGEPARQPAYATMTTTPTGIDASLVLLLPKPITIEHHLHLMAPIVAALIAAAGTVLIAYLLLLLGERWPFHLPVFRFLDALAQRFSSPGFLIFDRPAISYLILVTAFCLASAACKLHGSSISFMREVILQDVKTPGPLLGDARRIRSDEWAYFAPAILNQLEGANLAYRDTALGPGATALVGNLPSTHFTSYLRPQYWGFLALPQGSEDHAFAFYWQMKHWLLLTGMFLLFFTFTGNSWAAIVATLWLFFSSFTQWWYSTPCALPEMFGYFGFTIAGAAYLLVGRNRRSLFILSILTAIAAINFALCLYIPFMIPLTWLGVVLLVAFGIARYRDIITTSSSSAGRASRVGAIALCTVVIGIIMALFYRDAREAIHAIADTSYPGRRSLNGGDMPFIQLAANLLNLWTSENDFPPKFKNICIASGFYWLGPLALAAAIFLRRLPGSPVAKFSFISATILSAILTAWMVFKIPAGVGAILFLNKTHSISSQPALGIATILITCQFLFLTPLARPSKFAQAAVAAFAICGGIATIYLVNRDLHDYFAIHALLLGSALLITLIFALLTRRKLLFALAILLPHFFSNLFINPVDQGIPLIHDTALASVAKDSRLRAGKWLVYGADYPAPGYFIAMGFDVFNGAEYVPDLPALKLFDPQEKFRSVYNKASLMQVKFVPLGDPPQFTGDPYFGLQLWVNPADPALHNAGIQFVAFDAKPDPASILAAKLRPLFDKPIDGFYLYEFERSAR